jgi:hypothetical protein
MRKKKEKKREKKTTRLAEAWRGKEKVNGS